MFALYALGASFEPLHTFAPHCITGDQDDRLNKVLANTEQLKIILLYSHATSICSASPANTNTCVLPHADIGVLLLQHEWFSPISLVPSPRAASIIDYYCTYPHVPP